MNGIDKGVAEKQIDTVSNENKTCEFRRTIEEALESAADVRALAHEIALEIMDRDEITTSLTARVSRF